MLRHGLTTAAFCLLLAAALTALGQGSFGSLLVYALPQGLIAWLFIDIGRLWLSRDAPWPHGPRDFAVIAAGIAAGFCGGHLIGDTAMGRPWLGLLERTGHELVSTLTTTVVASIILCYFYYSRGRARWLEGRLALVQRDATEAHLKLLEAQLEPHMLFNTLANLRVLIRADSRRAVQMLDHLDRYLRAVLAGSRRVSHPLAAEFARLTDYLELMSVRMSTRLHYELHLPASLSNVPVPPLLLQPLVENAIRHGLEPEVAGGSIGVRARSDGALLILEVTDTGSSLPAADCAQGRGFGLSQVRERLATLYGEQGSLALLPGTEGGTCATLCMPLAHHDFSSLSR
jgi:Histidine kinase/Histidine kinase-, DNA gyrase B-, and HSP90-like ATPase